MISDRRKGLSALPVSQPLEEFLALPQMVMVRHMENFGWVLEIVRRHNRPTALALLKNHVANKWLGVESDGELIEDPVVSERDWLTVR